MKASCTFGYARAAPRGFASQIIRPVRSVATTLLLHIIILLLTITYYYIPITLLVLLLLPLLL